MPSQLIESLTDRRHGRHHRSAPRGWRALAIRLLGGSTHRPDHGGSRYDHDDYPSRTAYPPHLRHGFKGDAGWYGPGGYKDRKLEKRLRKQMKRYDDDD